MGCYQPTSTQDKTLSLLLLLAHLHNNNPHNIQCVSSPSNPRDILSGMKELPAVRESYSVIIRSLNYWQCKERNGQVKECRGSLAVIEPLMLQMRCFRNRAVVSE